MQKSLGIVSLDVLGDACDWVAHQFFQALNVLKDDSLIKSGYFFVTLTPSLQSWTKKMGNLYLPSHQIKDGKMARFRFCAASFLILAGGGGMGVCCSILFCPRF